MATNDKGAEPFVAIHNAMLKVLQVVPATLPAQMAAHVTAELLSSLSNSSTQS